MPSNNILPKMVSLRNKIRRDGHRKSDSTFRNHAKSSVKKHNARDTCPPSNIQNGLQVSPA